MPLREIGSDLRDTVKEVKDITTSKALRRSIAELEATLRRVGKTVRNLDKEVVPPSFYTLNATLPATEKPAAPHPDQDLAVGIGPVRFPAFLDGPQIVARTTHNQLRVDEFHRWGGSLEDDFLRVLSENLGQLLDTSRILVEPAEVRFPLDFRVVADVLKFEGMLGGDAVFKVRWGCWTPICYRPS